MIVSKVTYTGNLRTQATHIKSGNSIITDAPTDNEGKGEAFSPTDLVATATACCMLTVMGIAAKAHNITIDGTEADVVKIMENSPRRISEIHISLRILNKNLSGKEKNILERSAKTCPVILSLSNEIKKVIEFNYV